MFVEIQNKTYAVLTKADRSAPQPSRRRQCQTNYVFFGKFWDVNAYLFTKYLKRMFFIYNNYRAISTRKIGFFNNMFFFGVHFMSTNSYKWLININWLFLLQILLFKFSYKTMRKASRFHGKIKEKCFTFVVSLKNLLYIFWLIYILLYFILGIPNIHLITVLYSSK